MRIENATPNDFGAIGDLNVAAYAEFAAHLQPGSWELMQENLRNVASRAETAEFVICRERGEIVGSVAYCPAGNGDSAFFTPEMASMLLLAVHPKTRGCGLARALIAECLSRAKRDEARAIALFTSELMVAAQQLYRDFGFEQECELPKRHGVRYFRFVLKLAGGQ